MNFTSKTFATTWGGTMCVFSTDEHVKELAWLAGVCLPDATAVIAPTEVVIAKTGLGWTTFIRGIAKPAGWIACSFAEEYEAVLMEACVNAMPALERLERIQKSKGARS